MDEHWQFQSLWVSPYQLTSTNHFCQIHGFSWTLVLQKSDCSPCRGITGFHQADLPELPRLLDVRRLRFSSYRGHPSLEKIKSSNWIISLSMAEDVNNPWNHLMISLMLIVLPTSWFIVTKLESTQKPTMFYPFFWGDNTVEKTAVFTPRTNQRTLGVQGGRGTLPS